MLIICLSFTSRPRAKLRVEDGKLSMSQVCIAHTDIRPEGVAYSTAAPLSVCKWKMDEIFPKVMPFKWEIISLPAGFGWDQVAPTVVIVHRRCVKVFILEWWEERSLYESYIIALSTKFQTWWWWWYARSRSFSEVAFEGTSQSNNSDTQAVEHSSRARKIAISHLSGTELLACNQWQGCCGKTGLLSFN